MTDNDAVVVKVGFNLSMVVASQRNLEIGISLADDLECLLHHLHGAFVHGDGAAVKPALLLQVTGKRGEHGHPHLFVGRLARSSFDSLQAVGSLIIVLKREFPRHHGVAVDLLVDAYAHHELHPTVEECVVEGPGTINPLYPGNHRVEIVFGLSVPGFVHDRGGNNLLTCISQSLHQGAHGLQMSIAPERHLMITCHGVGVLPEIEMECPFRGLRQDTVHHLDGKMQALQQLRAVVHQQVALVGARNSRLRNPALHPDRLYALCRQLHGL